MKKRIATMIALGLMAAAPAHAGTNFSLSLFAPGPVYYEPAPVFYSPRPVYYAPRPVAYYAPPAPFYYRPYYSYSPPIYYGGYNHHRHREHDRRDGRWDERERHHR